MEQYGLYSGLSYDVKICTNCLFNPYPVRFYCVIILPVHGLGLFLLTSFSRNAWLKAQNLRFFERLVVEKKISAVEKKKAKEAVIRLSSKPCMKPISHPGILRNLIIYCIKSVVILSHTSSKQRRGWKVMLPLKKTSCIGISLSR